MEGDDGYFQDADEALVDMALDSDCSLPSGRDLGSPRSFETSLGDGDGAAADSSLPKHARVTQTWSCPGALIPSTLTGTWHVGAYIEKGAYGSVHRAVNVESRQEVAVKVEEIPVSNARKRELLERELAIGASPLPLYCFAPPPPPPRLSAQERGGLSGVLSD
jgi:hypothetical protein